MTLASMTQASAIAWLPLMSFLWGVDPGGWLASKYGHGQPAAPPQGGPAFLRYVVPTVAWLARSPITFEDIRQDLRHRGSVTAMTVDNALKELRELLITELSSSQNVELEPLIEGLGMSEEEREDLDDEILDSSQGLIGLARHLNETPMTNTSASAVWLLDIGGDYQFLYSPGDSWVDYPATVFALVPTGDLSAVFKEVGSIIVWSRRNGELPAAGSLHDDIGVCEGFPTAVLEDAYTELFMDPLDAEEAKELLEHYGRVPSHSGPITSRALAHAYVAMALGED